MAHVCGWAILCMMTGGLAVPVRPEPVPNDPAAFLWATTAAARLIRAGIPSSIRDGNGVLMVRQASDCVQQQLDDIPRTVGCVEIFAGRAGITRGVLARSVRAYAVERLNFAFHDCCTLVGTLYVLYTVATVVQSGCIWLSPQCSTWLHMCCGHTGRSRQNPYGSELRNDCKEANYIALLT